MGQFIKVDETYERCGRATVRVTGGTEGDVSISKGDGKKIVFPNYRSDLDWYCENPGESDKEHSSSSSPFNAVLMNREHDGRLMHVIFGSEIP